jgi:hypothetical protein
MKHTLMVESLGYVSAKCSCGYWEIDAPICVSMEELAKEHSIHSKEEVSVDILYSEDDDRYVAICPFCGSVNEFEDKSDYFAVKDCCEHLQWFSPETYDWCIFKGEL